MISRLAYIRAAPPSGVAEEGAHDCRIRWPRPEAADAWWAATPVFEAWCIGRHLTMRSLALAYAGADLPLDLTQLVVTGTLRPSWSAANLLASGVLLLLCGLVRSSTGDGAGCQRAARPPSARLSSPPGR